MKGDRRGDFSANLGEYHERGFSERKVWERASHGVEGASEHMI